MEVDEDAEIQLRLQGFWDTPKAVRMDGKYVRIPELSRMYLI